MEADDIKNDEASAMAIPNPYSKGRIATAEDWVVLLFIQVFLL